MDCTELVPTHGEPQTSRRGPSTGPLKKVLLVSNEVMHYRVSVYNYFHRRFRESGYEFCVLTDRLQKQNRNRLQFELRELPFDFLAYRKAILELQPAVVILFLHLRDLMVLPLMHWLRLRKIPFAFWTKGVNSDAKDSKLYFHIYNYMHGVSDALILYAESCREYLKPRYQAKVFIANNTINFEDFPAVRETKEEIRKEFGIPFSKSVIFIGRMEESGGRKRVDHLIDIFRGLDRNDVGLVLVGSGLKDEWKARMNPANTIYLGEVHDPENIQISKLFKMADVCAIPGHVGLGLNQAFYFGLPVVTEDGDHPPEIAYLKPGRNGFIVPEGDLAALKERILYLLDDDQVRAQFSQHAREDIMSEASTEGMFSAFRQCMDYLTNRPQALAPASETR